MSNFNEANELASELVLGRTYQGNEPTPMPERLVFVKGDSTAVVTAMESEEEWADVASVIHRLFDHGFRLGCDMDVSWNGTYDTDGDPLPGGPGNYLACRNPVSVSLDGRHLCDKHDCTDYKAKWLAAQQGSAEVMSDLLQSTIRKYEQERERHASDEEIVAFCDRLITGLKERGHVFTFPADNGFKCPTCGEEL